MLRAGEACGFVFETHGVGLAEGFPVSHDQVPAALAQGAAGINIKSIAA